MVESTSAFKLSSTRSASLRPEKSREAGKDLSWGYIIKDAPAESRQLVERFD